MKKLLTDTDTTIGGDKLRSEKKGSTIVPVLEKLGGYESKCSRFNRNTEHIGQFGSRIFKKNLDLEAMTATLTALTGTHLSILLDPKSKLHDASAWIDSLFMSLTLISNSAERKAGKGRHAPPLVLIYS